MSRSPYIQHWGLDPAVTYLNHGSFGATPIAVLEEQDRLRRRLEREPVRFLYHELDPMLDAARVALGRFLGADPDGLAFVSNATAGVNTVLRSLEFEPGDELITTNQEYIASRNALDFVADRAGATVVIAPIPFPVGDPSEIVDAVMSRVTDRTKLVLIDHVTSSTGMILPTPEIVARLDARGIDALVDGAHAPGMLDVDLEAIGAAYYTGNGHKWISTPKGAAFLHVRRDRQHLVRPLPIGHGASSTRTDRSRYRLEMDWPGTHDPSPWLCFPKAIEAMGSLFPDGWAGLRRYNRDLVLHGRELLCDALGVAPPCPDSMIGSLASLPVPDGNAGPPPHLHDSLHMSLYEEERIEVPVFAWPRPPKRLLRISAQAYNCEDDFAKLATALRVRLPHAVRA